MKQHRIIVLGDANVDMIVRLPDRTAGKLDLTGSVPQLQGGGSAANVAVALARLGQNVSFVGAIGDDGYGRWVIEDLAREGVDATGLYPVSDKFTPMVLALIEPHGERLVVVWPPEDGAHHHLPQKALHSALWQGATWLHTSGMCLRHSPTRETILRAMEEAKSNGVMVSLDLNIRNELWGFDAETRATFERAAKLSDVVLGNAEEEVCLLAETDAIEEATQVLSDGRRTIIARLGPAGALAATPSGLFRAPGLTVDVVDTLGAGDAFDAGFIAARIAGRDIQEAMRWGNGVAALTISNGGARSSPKRQELSAFLTSNHE